MKKLIQKFPVLQDPVFRWLFVGGFVFAWFFGQGVPLWDDDFTSWFWKIKDRSIFSIFIDWVSPISTQPQYWGFNERPIQALVYKICYLISGYESWSYFLYKDLVYAGLGVMVYLWGLRLVGQSQTGKLAALAAAVFYIAAPGPVAAHVIHSDLATTAELLFLVVTYFIWKEVEATPESWTGTPKFHDPAQRKWLIRWAVLSFATYLSYKSKADLKVIPAIFAAYILALPARRKQLGFFAFPIGMMVLLAVPWGPGIFTQLPPFMPGSKGSEIGWMWQPASTDRLKDFLWNSGAFDIKAFLRSPTLSLAAMLGPFLLLPLLAFLLWKMKAFDEVQWTKQDTSIDRARTFSIIWFVLILIGVSALPAINYTFRIRYGIITLLPVSLLLAWAFGLFVETSSQFSKWIVRAAVVLLAVQCSINLYRSINFRRDLGQVMVAVDQAYGYAKDNLPAQSKLVLFPDFRPYDYRPDAGRLFQEKTWLQSTDELPKRFKPMETYAISWSPSLWEQVELTAHLSGCYGSTLFDLIFPCPKGTGAFLMRFIGAHPLYAKGEEFRSKRQFAEALKTHEEFLQHHPGSLAGHFVIGLESYELKNWARAQQAYAYLEKYLPNHLSIVYNHALVLAELGQHDHAISRLEYILTREPSNYGTVVNLFYLYKKAGRTSKAKSLAQKAKKLFPSNQEVDRMLASV